MIMGIDRLTELVRKIRLVEDLGNRELENPEGSGFDLRLGELYELRGDAFIGIDERYTPESKMIAAFEEGKRNYIDMKPGQYLLGKTIEKINLPSNLVALFKPRTTTYRSGLIIRIGAAAPGYSGQIIFAIANHGEGSVRIELGARMIHVLFVEVSGTTRPYCGPWKDGRVSAPRREKQL